MNFLLACLEHLEPAKTVSIWYQEDMACYLRDPESEFYRDIDVRTWPDIRSSVRRLLADGEGKQKL